MTSKLSDKAGELAKSIMDLDYETAIKLQRWIDTEPETGHSKADELLVELLGKLGFRATVKAYNAITPKWYS